MPGAPGTGSIAASSERSGKKASAWPHLVHCEFSKWTTCWQAAQQNNNIFSSLGGFGDGLSRQPEPCHRAQAPGREKTTAASRSSAQPSYWAVAIGTTPKPRCPETGAGTAN